MWCSVTVISDNNPLGILGGTFDPIHLGHLRSAEELLDALPLAQISLLPCHQPSHRQQPQATSAQRCAMLTLVCDDNPRLALDDRECHRPGPSYMVDTLLSLRQQWPQRPLCLILGMDAFLGLPHWHRWSELLGLAHIIVIQRPGYAPQMSTKLVQVYQQQRIEHPAGLSQTTHGAILEYATTPLAISASQIRTLLHQGQSCRYLLPEKVYHYIQQQQLYQ